MPLSGCAACNCLPQAVNAGPEVPGEIANSGAPCETNNTGAKEGLAIVDRWMVGIVGDVVMAEGFETSEGFV